MEDPSFRRSPIYSPTSALAATVGSTSTAIFGQANSLIPVVLGVNAAGAPIGFGFTDGIQRNRMPDFVGVLRYDQPWGSAQISAAVHELNTGNVITQGGFLGFNSAGQALSAVNAVAPRTQSEYGWAVQGGLKINAPFIAPGDAFYLQAPMPRARRCTPATARTAAPTRSTRPRSRARRSTRTSPTRRSTRSPTSSSSPRASRWSVRSCTTGSRVAFGGVRLLR